MTHTDIRSLQQIRRETEQTRAGLTSTVEQLRSSMEQTVSDIRHRVSPDAIKAEVSGYIRSRGERLLDDVGSAARRNPMQAVVIGASLAYPLLRLARAIPVPVLMVGAGLFFAGSRTGQAATQKASDIVSNLTDETVQRARELGEQIGEGATAAKKYASDQLDRVGEAVSSGVDQLNRTADAATATLASDRQKLRDNVVSAGNSLSDRAADLKEHGASIASAAAGAVQDMASGATVAAANFVDTAAEAARNAVGASVEATRHAADATAEAGMATARAVRDKAADLSGRAEKSFFRTIEQNPLLVVGAGLVIGGLIASVLPRSEIEDEIVGDTSSAVKRRAQTMAAEGLDSVGNAVGEIYDDAARQAEAEGLTPDGVAKAAQDVGQRARRVAESAINRAFEPSDDDNIRSSAHGGRDHG
jgi:hypothetical protein